MAAKLQAATGNATHDELSQTRTDLLNNSACMNSTGVVAVWVILHSRVCNIAGLAHLCRLQHTQEKPQLQPEKAQVHQPCTDTRSQSCLHTALGGMGARGKGDRNGAQQPWKLNACCQEHIN